MNFSERLHEIRTGFERPFWVANITEIFERLSYYGAFASLARYLQEKLEFLDRTDRNSDRTLRRHGLVSGHLRRGRRRPPGIPPRAFDRVSDSELPPIFCSARIGASWLAPVRNAVPLGLFVGFILILPALGVALVKPCVVGTTARASKENVRSIGYSIYYTMVNIGGAAGPYFASWAHRHLGVENVYRVAALSVFAMFFVVLFFFREPRQAGDAPPPSIATVARNFCVVVGNYRLVLPVLGIALLLRIADVLYPFTVPWWIWIGLLLLVLAGISRFMWFLVLFTGYWVVFWQQYISLPGYIHGYINANADVEIILVTDGLTVICLTLAGELSDAARFRHFKPSFWDTVITSALVADPRFQADGLGRGALTVRSGAGRDHPIAALLRIHFAPRAARPARDVHGLCVFADRNRLADWRLVRGNACPSLWGSHTPTGTNVVDRDRRGRGHRGVALDL